MDFDVAGPAQRARSGPLLAVATPSSSPPAEPVPIATPTRAICSAVISKFSRSVRLWRAICFFSSRPRFLLATTCRNTSTPASRQASQWSGPSASASNCPRISKFACSSTRSTGSENTTTNVGLADLGTSGPYGLYSTVGARWTFGGYGRAHRSVNVIHPAGSNYCETGHTQTPAPLASSLTRDCLPGHPHPRGNELRTTLRNTGQRENFHDPSNPLRSRLSWPRLCSLVLFAQRPGTNGWAKAVERTCPLSLPAPDAAVHARPRRTVHFRGLLELPAGRRAAVAAGARRSPFTAPTSSRSKNTWTTGTASAGKIPFLPRRRPTGKMNTARRSVDAQSLHAADDRGRPHAICGQFGLRTRCARFAPRASRRNLPFNFPGKRTTRWPIHVEPLATGATPTTAKPRRQ